MDGFQKFLMTDPSWAAGLSMMQGQNPQAGIQAAFQNQALLAAQEEEARQKQAQQVLGDAIAGGITQEAIGELARLDPQTALKLQEMYLESQSTKVRPWANPATGEMLWLDVKTGMPVADPRGGKSGGGIMPSAAPSTPIPQEILDNPKALQTYLETLAKENAKAGAAGAQKEKKASSFSDTLGTMSGYIDKLQASGALLDSTKSPIENMIQSARLSEVGQMASRSAGKPSQDTLDAASNLIPQLMQDMKKATGMTASEINSIPEMELLKKSLADPSKSSYQTLTEVLTNLEKKYGIQKPSPNVSAVPDPSDAPRVINFEDLK
jgi:hypothetical protein